MIPPSTQLGMDNELAREVETLRKKLQDWKQVLVRMEGYIHDKQSAWGTDPDDIVMLQRIDVALATHDAAQLPAVAHAFKETQE